jgi:hypothetical protein
MSQLQIVPSEQHTVTRLMELLFPGIKATDCERTPLVSKHTIGYIHALMIDSVTALSTEPPKARALRNETMVVEELELNKDVFRSELRDCLVDYYVNILKMDGTGGMPLSSTFKSISANAATDGEGDAAAAGGGGGGGGDADNEANQELVSYTANSATPPPAAAAAAEHAPAEDASAEDAPAAESATEAASPPGKGGRGVRRGAKGAKAT